MSQGSGIEGLQRVSDSASQFNAYALLVKAMLSKIGTCAYVKVKAVTNAGGVSPVGMVDMQPLVNQVDGEGNAVPHGTIYACPYFRIQGGGNAVIIDPQVGDIGLALFPSRDSSSVVATKGQANPGSARMFDMSDGVYLGAFLGGTPSQYVQFSMDGINIHSPTKVTLEAPDVQITAQTMEINATSSVTVTTPTFTVNGISMLNGPTTVTGLATVVGATVLDGPLTQGSGTHGGTATMQGPLLVATDVIAADVSLVEHPHGGVQRGTGLTDPPTPI